jgi:hypothetical protein
LSGHHRPSSGDLFKTTAQSGTEEMTTHLFRLLAFSASISLLSVPQFQSLCAASREDSYLTPIDEDRETREPEASYKKAVEQKLFLTPGEIARVVRLPGTVGRETVVAVYRRQPPKQAEYAVTVTQPSRSLWDPENKSEETALQSTTILRLDAGLPETTALAIQKVWQTMLLDVREPPASDELLLESSTQIFSAAGPDGKLMRGQLEGLGAGETAALSNLVDLLIEYCDAPESGRDDIAHKIDKAAGNLLSRVTSKSGNHPEIRNSEKARGRKQRSNVSGKAVVVPTGGTLALISNATEGPAVDARSNSPGFASVRILRREGMIVPQEYLRESGLPAEGFWTPKRSQLREVERSLPTFLRKEMQARPLGELSEVIALAPKYRRQYVGMILNGRKVIWINCIPPKPEQRVDPFANWNHEIIEVSDGGSDFWGVVYDVEKHSFDRLILNGSA